MDPAAIRTVGEPGFALLGHPFVANDRTDPAAPVGALSPAPGGSVCDPEQGLRVRSEVVVGQDVLRARLATGVEQNVHVSLEHRVFLLDDQPATTDLGEVDDDLMQAGCPGVLLGSDRIAAPS